MKLLFDQNLSPNLAKYFEGYFNTSQHLQDIGFDASDDHTDKIKAFVNDLDNGILSIF